MGELYRVLGERAFEQVTKHVEYLLATQPDEYLALFAEALRRNVPGRGGDVMNCLQQLIERGRREALQEGELKGQIRTIEGFLERDFSWSTIATATGIDEAAFRQLKRQLRARQLEATRDGADR